MRDNRNLLIGLLSITATILLVGVLVLSNAGQNQAFAFGQLDRGGDYVMLTGQFSQNSELVYITDAAAQRLNVYSYEPTTRQFVLWQSIDLTRFMGKQR